MTTNSSAAATIEGLTAKGRETMTSIGRIAFGGRELGFFDDGVAAGSGSWGECLTGELGHRSAGVINRLAKLGLFDVSHDVNGAWFSLTELGAEVALLLAAPAAEAAPVAEASAEPVEAGHVSLMTGRPARARRSAGVVRYADAAGRTRTASADVASTFVPLTAFDLDRDHGVAYIEAAGMGVRILTEITVDQHDAAFGASAWPAVERAALHGAVDSRRVAIGGQWYDVTRVQMPDGERRRFARQYNGYGDGRPAEREISMGFACAWSPVAVVGWTEAEIEAEHEADAERMAYVDRLDAEAERPVETVELPAPIELTDDTLRLLAELEAHQMNDKVDAVASVGLPLTHGAVADALVAAVRPALADRVDALLPSPQPVHAFLPTMGHGPAWGGCQVTGCGRVYGHQVHTVTVLGPEGVMTVERDGDGNPNVCSHGYRFENGLCPHSTCGASTYEPTITTPINDRMAVTLRYFNDPTPENAAPVRALRGQHTGTMHALKRRRLTEPIDVFPFTALTALGRQQLADYYRTDPQT